MSFKKFNDQPKVSFQTKIGGSFATGVEYMDISAAKEQVIHKDGSIRVLPVSFWKDLHPNQCYLLLKHLCINVPPTVELLEWLASYIGTKKTIEIAAGYGGIGKNLGITSTDSYLMAHIDFTRRIDEINKANNIPEDVKYGYPNFGSHVEQIDGLSAVRKYKPDIVIAAHAPQRINQTEIKMGFRGDPEGVDEISILKEGVTYIHIANDRLHEPRKVFKKCKVEKVFFPFLISDTINQEENVIYICTPL